MTHTALIRLVFDAAKPDGTLYHTLTVRQREHVWNLGRVYATAHATGNTSAMQKAEGEILRTVQA